LVAQIPLPPDEASWRSATACWAAGDLPAYAEAATAMYRLPSEPAAAVLAWWHPQRE
jgi:hypothetical protein